MFNCPDIETHKHSSHRTDKWHLPRCKQEGNFNAAYSVSGINLSDRILTNLWHSQRVFPSSLWLSQLCIHPTPSRYNRLNADGILVRTSLQRDLPHYLFPQCQAHFEDFPLHFAFPSGLR